MTAMCLRHHHLNHLKKIRRKRIIHGLNYSMMTLLTPTRCQMGGLSHRDVCMMVLGGLDTVKDLRECQDTHQIFGED